jgi:hypothetical protein
MYKEERAKFDRCIIWLGIAFAALAFSKMLFVYEDNPTMRHKPQGRVHAKRLRTEDGK